jgi:8-oxo-dGTP pyrophosphatase MutT (NUDIX family)
MDEIKQVAALPVRKGTDGQFEVLLVTSRETGRWVIPKGWPSRRLSDRDAAAREARQEAGVVGTMKSRPIGTYRYRKVEPAGTRLLDVTVFLLKVEKEMKRWSEQDQRRRTWFKADAAARRVREPSLQKLIRELFEKPAKPSKTA